jgi:hypothetical protein
MSPPLDVRRDKEEIGVERKGQRPVAAISPAPAVRRKVRWRKPAYDAKLFRAGSGLRAA